MMCCVASEATGKVLIVSVTKHRLRSVTVLGCSLCKLLLYKYHGECVLVLHCEEREQPQEGDIEENAKCRRRI